MDALAHAAERVAATNSRREKIAHVASYLQSLNDADLARAVLYLSLPLAVAAGVSANETPNLPS